MIDFKLAKQLKDSGFPQEPLPLIDFGGSFYEGGSLYYSFRPEVCILFGLVTPSDYEKYLQSASDPTSPANNPPELIKAPTLEELIAITPLAYLNHNYITDGNPEWEAQEWEAAEISQDSPRRKTFGHTPEEAVAKLWLAFQEPSEKVTRSPLEIVKP